MSTKSHSFAIKLLWMLIIGTTPVSTKGADLIRHKLTDQLEYQKNATITPLFNLPTSPSFKVDLSCNTKIDKEYYPRVNIRHKRSNTSTETVHSYSLHIHKELTTNQMRGIATGELIRFFVESSTGRNVYVFYDRQIYPDISEGVSACFKILAEVTLLQCGEAINQIEKIIKAFNTLESLRNIIVLCNSRQTMQIFQQIHEKYLESTSTHWFVVLQDDGNDIYKILSLLREGTQVSIAKREYDFKYNLFISFITVDNKVSLQKIGWWNWNSKNGSSSFLKALIIRPLEEIYSNFRGRQLSAAVIDNWPYWHLEYSEDGSARPVSGLDFHVLTDIGDKLNFTFRMELLPKGFGTGRVKPDGTVSGVIGEVHHHSVHLAINEVTLTENREHAVDFTYPHFLESKTLISPAPKKKLKEYAVFTSFTYEVWILLLIVTILIGPIVKVIVWIKKTHLSEIHEQWDSLSDVSFVMFRSIMLQAAPYPPKGLVFTLAFMSWYFFCLLVTSLYSDVMISTLVVPSYEKPIDSLWDLLDAIEHRDYKLVINCGSNNEFIFSNTKQKIYKDIWRTFGYSLKCIKNKDAAMDQVVAGKYVVVNNRMGAEVRANLRGRERYHIARNEFYAHGYGIACPSGSPYRDTFQSVILPLMWSGLVQKYTNDELRKARKTNFHDSEGPEPISLLHLQSGFFMFVAGNIAATIALVTERISHQYPKKSTMVL